MGSHLSVEEGCQRVTMFLPGPGVSVEGKLSRYRSLANDRLEPASLSQLVGQPVAPNKPEEAVRLMSHSRRALGSVAAQLLSAFGSAARSRAVPPSSCSRAHSRTTQPGWQRCDYLSR